MSITTQQLCLEIEATAKLLGRTPSTVGRMAGQGGRFYSRLKDGKRVWPETADAVLKRLQELRASAECEPSHGREASGVQGDAA